MDGLTTVTSPRFAVRIGTSREMLAVSCVADVSDIMASVRHRVMSADKGASSMPSVRVYDVATMKPIGKASWNGRVWSTNGSEITKL